MVCQLLSQMLQPLVSPQKPKNLGCPPVIPVMISVSVTEAAVTLLVLHMTTRYWICVPPTKLVGSELAMDFESVKELMPITAEPGTPGPRLLVTAAVLVMGPVGQAQLIVELIVQVAGLAQAEAKFPTFQVKVFPEKLPQELVSPVKQAGKGSVTTTLFSGVRFQTVRFLK